MSELRAYFHCGNVDHRLVSHASPSPPSGGRSWRARLRYPSILCRIKRDSLMLVFVPILFLVSSACAQTVAITPSTLIGVEGSNLTVGCSLVGGGSTIFELSVNGSRITTLAKFIGASMTPTGTQFVYGPLERSESGIVFECDDGAANKASATLVVNWPPTVSPVGITASLVEGQDHNVMYTVDLGNPPSSLSVAGPGQLPFTNTGVLINNVNRSNNGSYTATWRNGVGEAVFTLDLVVTAERGPEPLVLNACNPSSTSVTVISDIPGIEFPNPMVDCSDSRVTVSGGSITVRCDQFPAGQTTIQCMTSTGKDIKFVVFASISPSGMIVGGLSGGAIAGIVIAIIIVIGLVIAGGVWTGFLVKHLKQKK